MRSGPAGSTGSSDARGEAALSLRRPHTARWVGGAVLAVAACLVALLAGSRPQTVTEVQTPLVGRTAPAITGTTLAGSSFHLQALRGRWVVVNFFASWCPPCQQEQAELVAFAYAHRAARAAALVGVVFDDSATSARTFMRATGATWPAVVDPGGQVALDFGVRGPPETFLVSPSGEVVAHFDGPMTARDLDYWLGKAQESAA